MRSAIRALARSNYRTTSIAEIAAEAGITEPAVYRYFPTKEALFIAIIEDVGQRVLSIWNAIREESPGPLEALARIGRDYYERAMTRRGDLKVLFQALAEVDDDEIRQALRVQFSSYVDLLTDAIKEAQRTHMIRENVDAKAAAWCFLSVGFTLNLVGLLRLETDLSRARFELIRELFIGSLLNDRNANTALASERADRPPEDALKNNKAGPGGVG
jgi:AcrR family transcriptional regulator